MKKYASETADTVCSKFVVAQRLACLGIITEMSITHTKGKILKSSTRRINIHIFKVYNTKNSFFPKIMKTMVARYDHFVLDLDSSVNESDDQYLHFMLGYIQINNNQNLNLFQNIDRHEIDFQIVLLI